MAKNGFKPGGDSCGLTRSSMAIEVIESAGVEVDAGYLDDWRHDVYVAIGACAAACEKAGSCMASRILTSSDELEDPTIHPRHLVASIS
jgi:hypothetical protein